MALYYNVDYQAYAKPLPLRTPCIFTRSTVRLRRTKAFWEIGPTMATHSRKTGKTLTGEGNYIWLQTTGRGHFVGVTMSVLQNQDHWWGEGDDMFFVDGEKNCHRSTGTGAEDYSWGHTISEASILVRSVWCTVVGEEKQEPK